MRNDKVIEWPTDISLLTKRYTEESIDFIKKNKSNSFLLYLAHGTPHLPFTVSKEFKGKSKHGFYGDMIEEIDWSTGEILKTLKKLSLNKNTLVLFTSDNGPAEKHDKVGKTRGSALSLRDWKGSLYEGGSRVPCVFQWPGRIPFNKSCDEMASVLDILPTFAGLAGVSVETPQKIDGKDIWPIISLKPGAKTPHKYLYYAGNTRISAVRTDRYKFIMNKRSEELYDLKNDIGETKNIADKYPEIVKELSDAITNFQEDINKNSLVPRKPKPKRQSKKAKRR